MTKRKTPAPASNPIFLTTAVESVLTPGLVAESTIVPAATADALVAETEVATLRLRTEPKETQRAREYVLAAALENCRLYASKRPKEEWARNILRFCSEAGPSVFSQRAD